jgi:hypothetical protein
MVIPGSTSGSTSAGAVCLAVGALALLAGHSWSLLLLVPAHVAMAGRLWPQVAIAGSGDPLPIVALSIVLVTMIPTVALSAMAMPQIVATLLPDRSPRVRSLIVAAGALSLALALILPAFLAPPARSGNAVASAKPAPPEGPTVAVAPPR